MAVFKSAILFVLFIHWVKAVQFPNDIEAEFNKIFHQIKQTMDNTWRWMRNAANKNYLRINEIFTARKAIEEGRHKYQDVLTPNETPIKPDDTKIQPETASPVPLITNLTTPKLITVAPSAVPELPISPQENTAPVQQPESANLQKTDKHEPETDTTKVPEQAAETEPECEDDTPTEQSPTVTKVDAETQTESQIPLEGEPNTNKLESPVVQDIAADSPAVEEVPESDDKIKIVEPIADKEEAEIIVADPPEHIEFEMKRGLSRSIYEQQNIIILFLFFLIIIMSAYFFLLSRTPHTCPTIVIGELGSNLKSSMHNIKK